MKIVQQPECVTLVAESAFDDALLQDLGKSICDSAAKRLTPQDKIVAPVSYDAEKRTLDIWKLSL